MKEYTVKIISEVIYLVDVQAKNKDDAEDIARYNFVGPCTIRLDNSDKEYKGIINDVWSGSDVSVVEEEK